MKMLNRYYENQHLNLVMLQNLRPLTHPNFNKLQLAMRPLSYRKGYCKQQPINCVSASQLLLKDSIAIPSYEDLPKENAYLPLYQNNCDSHNQLSVLMSLTELIIHKLFVRCQRTQVYIPVRDLFSAYIIAKLSKCIFSIIPGLTFPLILGFLFLPHFKLILFHHN